MNHSFLFSILCHSWPLGNIHFFWPTNAYIYTLRQCTHLMIFTLWPKFIKCTLALRAAAAVSYSKIALKLMRMWKTRASFALQIIIGVKQTREFYEAKLRSDDDGEPWQSARTQFAFDLLYYLYRIKKRQKNENGFRFISRHSHYSSHRGDVNYKLT